MQNYNGKVIVATFFYKHQAYLEYINSMVASLLVLERLSIPFDYWLTSGHFHMEICVNDVLTRFLNTEDATDIVIIDSDESWNPQHLIRLLMHNEELVCGVYLQTDPKKRNFPVVFVHGDDGSYMGKMLPDGNCLLEAERIPGGFMKISRTALQRWVDAYPDNWFMVEGRKVFNFFGNRVDDHTFHGMDFCFSDSMRKCGVKIWVDPICDISHWGIVPFNGTLDAHLRAQKANQEAGSAFAIVEQMAKEIEARNG